MINLDTLKRQHEDILCVINGIKGTVRQESLDLDAANIANQISILAGKLRVHLNSEDQFMYPTLLNGVSEELRGMAKRYIDEMGSIGNEFKQYKDNYNTKIKILRDTGGFLKATGSMMETLEARIEKENKMLYPLI